MTTLQDVVVTVEVDADGVALMSQEALTFARQVGSSLHAVVFARTGKPTADELQQLGSLGAAAVHVVDDDRLASYAPAAWAAAVVDVVKVVGAAAVLASGTPRGSELLAHVATRLDVAMAANVVAVESTEPFVVTRQVVGGIALEDFLLGDAVGVLTVAGHACDPAPAESPICPASRFKTPVLRQLRETPTVSVTVVVPAVTRRPPPGGAAATAPPDTLNAPAMVTSPAVVRVSVPVPVRSSCGRPPLLTSSTPPESRIVPVPA